MTRRKRRQIKTATGYAGAGVSFRRRDAPAKNVDVHDPEKGYPLSPVFVEPVLIRHTIRAAKHKNSHLRHTGKRVPLLPGALFASVVAVIGDHCGARSIIALVYFLF